MTNTKEPTYDELVAAVECANKFYETEFLAYYNNDVDVAEFAHMRSISLDDARQRIRVGRLIHSKRGQ